MNLFDLMQEMDDDQPIIKAPFTIPGSKAGSLTEILPLLPYAYSYIEPFGGSGVVLLNRRRSKLEVFNDRNSGIVDFYTCLQDPDLRIKLQEQLAPSVHSREIWQRCKDTWITTRDPVVRAAKWFYMVRFSYSSLGRNFGRATRSALTNKVLDSFPTFKPVHDRLRDVTLENQDWRRILKSFDDRDAVFYLDPPYLKAQHGAYKDTLSFHDHVELCETVMEMRGFVAVSSYGCKLYDAYPWSGERSWKVRTSVAGHARADEGIGCTEEVETLYFKEAK